MDHEIPKLLTPGKFYKSSDRFFIYPTKAAAKGGLMSVARTVGAKRHVSEMLGCQVYIHESSDEPFECVYTEYYFRSINLAMIRFSEKTYPSDECWIVYHSSDDLEIL